MEEEDLLKKVFYVGYRGGVPVFKTLCSDPTEATILCKKNGASVLMVIDKDWMPIHIEPLNKP
jgi:hypothetical protein